MDLMSVSPAAAAGRLKPTLIADATSSRDKRTASGRRRLVLDFNINKNLLFAQRVGCRQITKKNMILLQILFYHRKGDTGKYIKRNNPLRCRIFRPIFVDSAEIVLPWVSLSRKPGQIEKVYRCFKTARFGTE